MTPKKISKSTHKFLSKKLGPQDYKLIYAHFGFCWSLMISCCQNLGSWTWQIYFVAFDSLKIIFFPIHSFSIKIKLINELFFLPLRWNKFHIIIKFNAYYTALCVTLNKLMHIYRERLHIKIEDVGRKKRSIFMVASWIRIAM